MPASSQIHALTIALPTDPTTMASQQYGGPTALGFSKYASSSTRNRQPSFPSAVSSTPTASAKNTIATKEQIAASHEESVPEISHNSGAELAIAQANALKDEVEIHAAKFSSTVSSAVSSTRDLLQLIREALKEDDTTALKTVDDLWAELELLFEAAKGTKDALPDFLEKQRNNMSLYHGAMMNETYQETQQELNMQHKKVNVQHGVILEQQQAFQDYKAKTATKLTEVEDMRERVSRLVLEKGNLKDEIDKYVKLLEQEQSTKADDLEKADGLQKELETLVATKTQLLAEVEGLQKTITEMQEKSQAKEQKTTEQHAAELKAKTDLLAKETAKATGLTTLINNLKGQENNGKMALEKLRAGSKMINEKYNRMATEHSQAFSVSLLIPDSIRHTELTSYQKSKENTQKIENLTAEVERLCKEDASLKERLAELPALEQANSTLFKDKAKLLEQLGKLNMELDQAKESSVNVGKELATLTADLQAARSQNQTLTAQNGDLLSKQQKFAEQAKNASQAVTIFKNENLTLKSAVDKLKANQSAPAVGGAQLPSSAGEAVLKQQVQDLTEQKETLQKALDEWTALAKVSRCVTFMKVLVSILSTFEAFQMPRFLNRERRAP